MFRFKPLATAALLVALATVSIPTNAYSPGVAKWPTSSVTIFANPSNLDTDATSAENALKAAMAAWGEQSNAGFQFAYGGRVSDTSTSNDGRNVVIFRNATNGSALATTYSWYVGSSLVDSDTIFWDGYVPFVGSSSTCSNAAYIQDVATHEFGHSLGLMHSSASDATMYPSYSLCSQAMRTLSSDDIAGVEFLYPPSTPSANTAPSVGISSPGNNSSFVDGATITFTGSASDSQDGSLGSSLVWTSSLSGQIGTGSSFSRTLPVGTHVITAGVTDSGGLSASKQVTVTVTSAPPPPTGPTLTATGYKVKGKQKVDLSWSNLTSTTAVGFRNNSKVYSGSNTGRYTDSIGSRGAGTYSYKVCDSTGAACTNTVTVTF